MPNPNSDNNSNMPTQPVKDTAVPQPSKPITPPAAPPAVDTPPSSPKQTAPASASLPSAQQKPFNPMAQLPNNPPVKPASAGTPSVPAGPKLPEAPLSPVTPPPPAVSVTSPTTNPPVKPISPLPQNPPPGGKLPPSHLPPAPASPPPAPARVQKSPFRFLIPALGIGILILVGLLLFRRFTGNKNTATSPKNSNGATEQTTTTTITYWGLWEPTLIMREVISKFEAQNPGVKVNYQQQSIKDYRERLQNALKSNQGPDIYRFHVTWTPLFAADLNPIPATVLSAKDFEAQQYPVAVSWLKSSKGYMGLPLMYDGLGLFYNQSVFEAAGKTVPKTWEELQRLGIELTIPDKKAGQGRLLRGGLALGTTTNVDNWSDILGWLIIQNGGNPIKPDHKLGWDAISFYTSFTKPARPTEQTWDETLPSSTVAFATEKAVMMIAPSWRAFEVKDMNPNLKFGIAPLPQFPDDQVAWASFWVEGVSSHSDKNKQAAAWKLISFMNQKETLRDFYAAASKERLFGEIFARADMADQLKTDSYASAFVSQAPYAKSWFMASRTFDNGPNDKIIKYYEDAINAVIKGSTPDKVTPTLEQGISQVISQYRLPSSIPK